MKCSELRIGNHIEIRNTGHELLSMAMTEIEGNTDKWVRTAVDIQILEWIKNGTKAWEFRLIPLNSFELECLGFKHIVGDAIWDEYKLSDMDEIWHYGNGYFIDDGGSPFAFYQHTDEDTYNQLKWVGSVDELQNLYFFLEGKELEYKQPVQPKERNVKSVTQYSHKCSQCSTDDSVLVDKELCDDGVYCHIYKCKICRYQNNFNEIFPNL